MKDLDNGKVVGVVLADVRKVVNHQLLLNKLFDCGIGDSALAWFKSYLSDRTQQLIAPEGLPRVPCTQGVPQGSVLGPVLFSLYVRGLPSCVNNSTVLQFADDVNMYAAGDSAEEVIGTLNGDLLKLSAYLKGKRMALNPAKRSSSSLTDRQQQCLVPPVSSLTASMFFERSPHAILALLLTST